MYSYDLRQDVRNKFFSFLEDNGYVFIKSESAMTNYSYTHKDILEQSEKNISYHQCKYDKSDIIKNYHVYIFGKKNFSSEEIKKNFLLGSWDEKNIKDKDYIKELEYFISFNKKDELLKFITSLPIRVEEKISFLNKIPIALLYLRNIDLTKVADLLNNSNFTKEKKDRFYFNFLKARKSHLKGSVGIEAEKFLMDLYKNDLDTLKSYGVFFQNIKNKFEDIVLDIEEVGIGLFAIKLNIRKASKTLDGIDEDYVKKYIEKFTSIYGKREKTWGFTDIIDKSKNIIECIVYKEKIDSVVDSDISFEDFRGKIKQFLMEISLTTLKDDKLIENYTKAWLLKNKIDHNLSNKQMANCSNDVQGKKI